MSALFDLHEGASPLILSFPHSGTHMPQDIAKTLAPSSKALEDTDWHVPRLYDFAKALDVTWIEARVSRYVIDLNRDPGGASLYPGQTTTALCPLESFAGETLWQQGLAPDEAEIARRKTHFFAPYHDALAAQITRVKARHGFAILYDCHSIRGVVPGLFEGELPTLNLGTNKGQSCAEGLQKMVETVMAKGPFSQVSNGRFRGGWITRHYGRPHENVHALQMELAQRAYMDESPPWRWNAAPATRLQETLGAIVDSILEWANTKT